MTSFAGLPLTVKEHPRARRILVKLVPGKGLVVVVPRGYRHSAVADILAEKRQWIEHTRDALAKRGLDLSGQTPDPPDHLEFRAADRSHPVDYLDRPGRTTVTPNADRLLVRGPLADTPATLRALQTFTVKRAREFALPRLDTLSRRLALPYAALRLRRQRTRWGSCSARGAISLNAKLLFLPPELVDQLLLHELCHTRHLNHSPAYWALVEHHQPDCKRLEHELSRGGKYVPAWFAWEGDGMA
ncbi:SprT family zinc-dependent metalloprotease [Pseudodesulfovibrio sp.]|uniref:M48 family metallopeptidase n=1 Tax=Pseudodesulfovibrio sp. TaxID=2035812 RepID=UPI00263630FE|nr:SprT family zinc-dependent metalloprotease [Pseudodesulfovibrio sp.]MDD3312698.1 SprT family zinc-dependent metalloprotease [Pseudodesulfovibrio sp.]